MIQSWATCPFCTKVFELGQPEVTVKIDGHKRYVCKACQPKLGQGAEVPAKKPNGDGQNATP